MLCMKTTGQAGEEPGHVTTAGGIRYRVEFHGVLVLALLSALGSAAALSQQSTGTDADLEQLYSQAEEAQRRGDLRGAADKYAEILKARPELPEVRANLGLMHHLLGEYREAASDFEVALREKPDLFTANLFLGIDLLQLHQPERALTYLERAQHLNPLDVQAALHLGRVFADLHEFSKANEWYLRATGIDSGNADAWYGAGITYLSLAREAAEQLGKLGKEGFYAKLLLAESLDQRGQAEEALKAYQQLLEGNAHSPGLHAAVGFSYLLLPGSAKMSEAAAEFKAELAAHPGSLLAQLGLARIAIERGEFAPALEKVGMVWQADLRFLQANINRLWQGFTAEQIDGLEKDLRDVPAAQPHPEVTKFLLTALDRWQRTSMEDFTGTTGPKEDLALAAGLGEEASLADSRSARELYSRGHYTLCAQSLKRELGRLPSPDLLLLSECAYDSTDFGTTLAATERLAGNKSSAGEAWYWRAKACQKLALNALLRAGVAQPDSPRIHILLGDAYRENKNVFEAEAEYKKAIRLQPNLLAAHLGLARVYWEASEDDKAVLELNKVLELNPLDPEGAYMMGEILMTRHQYAEAMPLLSLALKGTESSLPRVHALRAKVIAAQGRTTEAVAELKLALDGDRDGSYHYQMYQLYKKLGNASAAADALQKSESLRKASDRKNAAPSTPGRSGGQ